MATTKITEPQLRALREFTVSPGQQAVGRRMAPKLIELGLLRHADVPMPASMWTITDRGRELLDQVARCTNCRGVGHVIDWKPRSIGQPSAPVRVTCRCRKLPAVAEPVPAELTEIPAWMLGLD